MNRRDAHADLLIRRYQTELWAALDREVVRSELPKPTIGKLVSAGLTRAGYVVSKSDEQLISKDGIIRLEADELSAVHKWLARMHRDAKTGMTDPQTYFWSGSD